jgi:hypothetical protein
MNLEHGRIKSIRFYEYYSLPHEKEKERRRETSEAFDSWRSRNDVIHNSIILESMMTVLQRLHIQV